MRYLLSGVALAALLATGLPTAAQTDATQPKTPPAASDQNTPAMPGTKAKAKHAGKSASMAHRRGGRASEDKSAEELNRQELARLQQTPNTGSSAMPARPAPDKGMAPKQ
ncbi:MAG: hypothetical protein ACLQJR_20415 [Stellaceae bacterium]